MAPHGKVRLFLPVVLIVAGLSAESWGQIAPDPAYRQSFEKWQAELVSDLKQNWIPLAGLFWLKPGANRFGADPNLEIVLPKGSAPPQAGVFELQGWEVTVRLEPGVQASVGGVPLTTAKLQPDTAGKATVIELGHLRLHVIKRGEHEERVGIRVKDLESPALGRFKGLDFYPLDLAYRVTATWVPSDGKRTVAIPTVLGDVVPTPVPGEVRFKINGQDLRLTALGGDAEHGLFFVFSDPTAKSDTYPAGRFLDTDPVKDGKVVLDFNRAYNPPCAFTPYATCPLAPRENRVAAAIPAGERFDRTAHAAGK